MVAAVDVWIASLSKEPIVRLHAELIGRIEAGIDARRLTVRTPTGPVDASETILTCVTCTARFAVASDCSQVNRELVMNFSYYVYLA